MKTFDKPFAPWMTDNEVKKEKQVRDKLKKTNVAARETYKNQVRKNYIL